MMVKRVMEWGRRNWPTAVVIFKVFWIMVFVIDALQSPDVMRIPEFVYVNY
jgi:hypothetical protein